MSWVLSLHELGYVSRSWALSLQELGSVSVSKAYKEHMHYLCSPDPGVTACSTKAKMTVIRMDLHSVTQGKVKTWEDNRERKRQHAPQNSDGYNLNEETSS